MCVELEDQLEDTGLGARERHDREMDEEEVFDEEDEMDGFIVDEDGGAGRNRRRRRAGMAALPGVSSRALEVHFLGGGPPPGGEPPSNVDVVMSVHVFTLNPKAVTSWPNSLHLFFRGSSRA